MDFEIISEAEFKSSGVESKDEGMSTVSGTTTVIVTGPAPEYPLTWCEFCKGYYIEEFHYGHKEEPSLPLP